MIVSLRGWTNVWQPHRNHSSRVFDLLQAYLYKTFSQLPLLKKPYTYPCSFFVHRCGRTARCGALGRAVLFLTPNELAYIDFLRINQNVSSEALKLLIPQNSLYCPYGNKGSCLFNLVV